LADSGDFVKFCKSSAINPALTQNAAEHAWSGVNSAAILMPRLFTICL
jgi:hypothetical protein